MIVRLVRDGIETDYQCQTVNKCPFKNDGSGEQKIGKGLYVIMQSDLKGGESVTVTVDQSEGKHGQLIQMNDYGDTFDRRVW